MEKDSLVIFDKNVIEFVTVAAETCGFLERTETLSKDEFVDTSLKMLPLLYLKANLLPPCVAIEEEDLEHFVSEEVYEIIRINIASVLADKDDYLEVFLPEMRYSDTPIKKNVSEDLADIYQDLKNFVFIFQLGFNQTMHDALVRCKNNFAEYWGQRLVNSLRALHDIKYNTTNPEGDDEDLYNEEPFEDDLLF
ncbi:DUF5063 domain-containing protein [Bacteroides propionicifaciens]|uniref:DUF5063 domain-containing protein n=1 Tax=Bacteroides propionicifaciens TaxID=392838 RepID=UPI000373F207|nr:DUF5063 domain-containing protein [Bacteroides propionicifaciens]